MTGRAWIELTCIALGLALLLNACTAQRPPSARDVADANDAGRTLSPKTANERLLLHQLSALPNGRARRIGDASVVADAPYHAASGHTCRALQMTPGGARAADHRLACTDGRGWFFVPNVFASTRAE